MNSFKTDFYKNIANIIREQLDLLNEHPVILREILIQNDIKYSKLLKLNTKITDDILLTEIKNLFEENCITERTYKNIKSGNTASNAFNIFIVIYVLNDFTSLVNEKYQEYGENKSIDLINLDMIMEPLKG